MNKPTFRKTNLSWIVDYDYERSNCTCHDWPCRCTRIERAWIDNINIRGVVDELYRTYNLGLYGRRNGHDSAINEYCFDRICYAFKIYDEDLYEVETGGGYYGDEVYGVYFENEEKIFNAYNELLSLNTNIEKIQYCLRLEYGYLIDCVESATSVDIIKTSPNNVRPPQKEYFIKVDKTVIEEYKNRDLPIAVCLRDGDKYKLVDGYHRFVANKDREKVDIIVLK